MIPVGFFLPNIFWWLNLMYICYNVWFMIKLFFKNPILMVWVAFCLTYLFLKPNMYIFYLLFMIMIPFKT